MDDFLSTLLGAVSGQVTSEMLSAFLLIFCYGSILMLWHLWRENGLYLYNIMAVIVANIQVLKITAFTMTNEPVILGTLLFATTFTVSDILTEHRGVKVAQLGVKLSFIAQILMTIFMLITLIYPVVEPGVTFAGLAIADSKQVINPAQYAMFILFVPSLRILIASITSYYLSQIFDIYLFKLLKTFTNQKFLWLRLNISSIMSGLLDNIIFSVIAWVILNPEPVSLHTLIFTYIIGTYGFRIIVSITSTPIIYLSYKLKSKSTNEI